MFLGKLIFTIRFKSSHKYLGHSCRQLNKRWKCNKGLCCSLSSSQRDHERLRLKCRRERADEQSLRILCLHEVPISYQHPSQQDPLCTVPSPPPPAQVCLSSLHSNRLLGSTPPWRTTELAHLVLPDTTSSLMKKTIDKTGYTTSNEKKKINQRIPFPSH